MCDFRAFILIVGVVLNFVSLPLYGQSKHPSFREDVAIEREKVLRTADQIDILWNKIENLERESAFLKKRLQSLEEQNRLLENQLATQRKDQVQDKKALLREVASIVKESQKNGISTGTTTQSAPERTTPSTAEKGYEHVVSKGESLWGISRNYTDQGVKVTVEDIRLANSLSKGQVIREGQKLFIPIK